jgi:RNase P subunit RPR2
MVEILRRGVVPSEKIYDVKCRACDSLLRFKESEGMRSFHRNESYLSVLCPVCNSQVSVETR